MTTAAPRKQKRPPRCRHCGKTFTPARPGVVTCGPECQRERLRRRKQITNRARNQDRREETTRPQVCVCGRRFRTPRAAPEMLCPWCRRIPSDSWDSPEYQPQPAGDVSNAPPGTAERVNVYAARAQRGESIFATADRADWGTLD